METILRMVMEGLGGCEGVLDVCREHLQKLVRKGTLTEVQLDDLLEEIQLSLLVRRKVLLEGARSECHHLVELLPIVTEAALETLEERVMALERSCRETRQTNF